MKSYNPFKMWGSYMGIGVYGLLKILSTTAFPNKMQQLVNFLPDFFAELFACVGDGSLSNSIGCAFQAGIYSLIFVVIIGFLIGWGIHSLFRRLN